MTYNTLFSRLCAYRRWAHGEWLDAIAAVDAVRWSSERQAALRLLHHSALVDRIFRSHLAGEPQALVDTQAAHTPSIEELRALFEDTDRWYQAYVEAVTPKALAERVTFTFTDGDAGCMSREEMLCHVLAHGDYHRGEVGRLLLGTGVERPWDTPAVYLHRMEPSRRTEGRPAAARARAVPRPPGPRG